MRLSSSTAGSVVYSENETQQRRAGFAVRQVAALALSLVGLCLLPLQGRAQNIQYTQNKPDQALRSPMRVDPATLGLSLEVPIANYPGRASLPINLIYSSKQWRLNFYDTFSSPTGIPRTISHPLFSEWAKAGWTTSADIPVIEWIGHTQIYNGSDGLPCDSCPSGVYYVHRIQVHMPGGASHELRKDDTPAITLTDAGTYYSVDGSNLRYDAISVADGTLYLPDGSQYRLHVGSAEYMDRNGNALSFNATTRKWTDTQNRALDLPLPASPSATTYTYSLPSSTGTYSYSVRWSTLQNALTNSDDSLHMRYLSNMTGGYSESWTTRHRRCLTAMAQIDCMTRLDFPALLIPWC